MDVYESLGRLYHDHQTLRAEYRKLLTLVVQCQSGVTNLDDVVVLLDTLSWQIVPKPPAPPATDN